MGHNLPLALITCIACTGVGHAGAATDGQAGSTSQGDLQIFLRIAPQVRLSNLQDVRLESSGLQPAQAQTEVCIYSRTGQYQLQAQGSGADASFNLSQTNPSRTNHGTAANHWSYQVQYDDGSGFRPLTSGVPLGGLSGADTHSQTCQTTGLNGHLQVSQGSIELTPPQHKRSGHYTGTLTLLVAPE